MRVLGTSVEILDLRHYPASVLRPVLEAEGELWEQRLHWDYQASARLLMQYLDNHMLPGFAALESGRVMGYVFCVYEENKAVIGDVFALPGGADNAGGESGAAHTTEETLLRHLFELLLNSPHVDRIESQLLLHPAGTYAEVFRAAGFQVFRRLFLVQSLAGRGTRPAQICPATSNYVHGARQTWRRPRGSSATPTAIILTVSSTINTALRRAPCAS